ncbi:MAG TPA: proline--tRNA ligase [Mycobacteriales bacterium]|jgi:prolyl-tRNA synthetase|nr:proline--tRNA ligase [Mycobacteriales bacterium]
MSSWFVHTLREVPAEAEVPSHRLLLRAGYVRRVAFGGYAWLPLGLKVLRNVERIVREEMDRIGALEVLFPALLPREPYETTGRWDAYGPDIFRLVDRRGADHLLAPTHEEMFALLAKAELGSYRDLPLSIYQVQTKFRDETRPRSGLLRTREFVMKDSYSFDLTDEGLATSYAAHREAYLRIFARLGIDVRVVSAVSGAMGGSRSEEFLAPTPVGEDTFASCAQCGYAANTEAVPSPSRTAPIAEPGPVEELDTPDTPTIETLAAAVGVPASATLKNLLVLAGDEVVAIGVPGDREVDLGRVEGVLGPVRLFEPADFAGRPELVRGYVGPQGMAGTAFRYLADRRVSPGTSWVTGANKPDRHARNVVAGRDFTVEQYADVVTVLDGDPCPTCGAPLVLERGVEVGHVFQLGRKYTDAFELDVSGPDGALVRPTMGSYGIGVSRAVAVVAEQHHDERGLIWPREVSPYDVHIVPVGRGDQPAHARDLAERLEDTGLRVLLDDREASAGVKLTDAELLGVPHVVVVGRRSAEGVVEVRDRVTGEASESSLDDVVWAVTR